MMEQKPRKLSDQVRDALRLKHYSIRTEKAYVDCVRRSIQFYHKCHPADIGAAGIESFHTRLAVHKNIAASPRNQNLSVPLGEVATAPGSPLGKCCQLRPCFCRTSAPRRSGWTRYGAGFSGWYSRQLRSKIWVT